MRKMILAAMAALVLAAPVMAQNQWGYVDQQINGPNSAKGFVQHQMREMYRDICDNHRGTGDGMEMQYCHGYETDMYGRITGRSPQSVAYVGWSDRDYAQHNPTGYYGDSGMPRGYYGNRYYDSPSLGIPGNGKTLGLLAGGGTAYLLTRDTRNHATRDKAVVGGALLGFLGGAFMDSRNNKKHEREQYEMMRMMMELESRRAQQAAAPPVVSSPPSTFKNVVNMTGDCLRINGIEYENGYGFTATSGNILQIAGCRKPAPAVISIINPQGTVELRCKP